MITVHIDFIYLQIVTCTGLHAGLAVFLDARTTNDAESSSLTRLFYTNHSNTKL